MRFELMLGISAAGADACLLPSPSLPSALGGEGAPLRLLSVEPGDCGDGGRVGGGSGVGVSCDSASRIYWEVALRCAPLTLEALEGEG